MHAFDETTEELARLIMAYAGRRIANPVPLDGPAPAAELARRAGQTITPEGVGGAEALRVWAEVLAPATISTDHPAFLAFVPGAPSKASVLFDLVTSASSTYGGSWLEGSGAVWAGNLAALVAARHAAGVARGERPVRWAIAAGDSAHSSVLSATRVMDADVISVPSDERGRLT